MPKSAGAKKKARKNVGVGIDFKKARHKVGKKLPKAQNETNTDFKARSINLPDQNVGEDKGTAVSSKNQTLKELLAHSGHYNGKVRHDALTDMLQLIKEHPEELLKQAGAVIEKLVERFSDQERPVRKSLLALLAGQVFPGLGQARLPPFLPLLLAHISGALTHLQEDIRRDAMSLLDALVSVVPQQVSAQFLVPALNHYSSLLSDTTGASGLRSGTQGHLLQVLRSLNSFLFRLNQVQPTNTNSGSNGDQNLDEDENSDKDEDEHLGADSEASDTDMVDINHCGVVMPSSTRMKSSGLFSKAWAEPTRASMTEARAVARPSSNGGEFLSLQRLQGNAQERVFEALKGVWKECAAMSSSPDAGLATFQCMEACIMCFVYHIKTQDLSRSRLSQDLEYKSLMDLLGSQFPICAPKVGHQQAMTNTLVLLNLAYLKLYNLYLGMASRDQGEVPGWIWSLFHYEYAVLKNGIVLPHKDMLTSSLKQPVVPADMYTVILSGIQPLLGRVCEYDEGSQQMIDAITALFLSSSAGSSAQIASLKFMQSTCSSPQSWPRCGSVTRPLVSEEVLIKWVKVFPKVLWAQAAHSVQPCILSILLSIAKYNSAGQALSTCLNDMQEELAPFYGAHVTLTEYPGLKSSRTRPRRMPIERMNGARRHCKLASTLVIAPPGIQELAVDLLFYFGPLHAKLLSSLLLICQRPCFPISLASQIFSMLANKARMGTGCKDFQVLCADFLAGNGYGLKIDCDDHLRATEEAEERQSIVASFALQAIVHCNAGLLLQPLWDKVVAFAKSCQSHYRLFLRLTLTGILTILTTNAAQLSPEMEQKLPMALFLLIGGKADAEPLRKKFEYQRSLELIARFLSHHPHLTDAVMQTFLRSRQQGEDASQEQSSDSDTHNEFLWKLFDDQMGRGDIQKDDQWRKHQYAKPPLEKAADVISHICQNKSIHAALICESLSIQLSAERLWKLSEKADDPETQRVGQQLKTTVETLYGPASMS